ncbi:MAG: hypothetical protein Q8N09_01380 [Thermodesulfovibrionia bacterium]|nr:hypothetical protein [Thermodesulfovibrionia bacterium]
MLRLIFRTILIIFILFVVTVVLAIWKGGEPFRWTGAKVVTAGRAIEAFGDAIDGIKKGSGKIKKKIMELKENLDLKQNSRQEEQLEDKGGDVHKNK